MITPAPTGTVFMTRYGTTWHADLHCTALDSARLNEGGHILAEAAERAASRRPCLVCATLPATEWTVTRENLTELMNLIGPSKPHWAPLPAGAVGVSVEIDGLTILAHRRLPRTVARFGDTVTRRADGTYTVQPAAPTT